MSTPAPAGAALEVAARADDALAAIYRFCAERDWAGWDPYDGLMARLWPLPLVFRTRAGRLYFIQAMKHSPLNLRRLLLVPPLRNPKAMALGLSASCALAAIPGAPPRFRDEARRLVFELLAARVETTHGHGWGYPFDWQSRAFFLPRGTPTVVCSGFVARALDTAGRLFADDPDVQAAVSAGLEGARGFVLGDLGRLSAAGGFCWSYSPLDRSMVVNASLLGAETVSRAMRRAGDATGLNDVAATVRWALSRRRADGGWSYGEASYQRWEDGFHTGFNLKSLRAVREALAALGHDPEAVAPHELLDGSYTYYVENFFDPDGRPWYYRHTPWPADAHGAAVAILTFVEFRDRDPRAMERATRTLDWTLRNMWDRRGWFSFQIKPAYRIRIPYLRWCQAWMLLALAAYSRARRP